MDLTPRHIQEKQFHDAFRGYSHEEVDLFLDQVAEAFEKVYQQNQAFHHRLREIEEELTNAKATEDMLKRTLITAQKTAEQAIEEARGKAQQMIAAGERKSQEIVNAAEERAQAIVAGAQSRERELQAVLEGLKRFEQEYRTRLHAFIESQLRVLNEGPAAPPAPRTEEGPRPPIPSPRPQPQAHPAASQPAVPPPGPESVVEPPAAVPRPTPAAPNGSPQSGLPPARVPSAPVEDAESESGEGPGKPRRRSEEEAEEERSIKKLFWGEE